ncbi:MAG: hypothetical protein ACE5NG_15045, partial [bacterium]
MKANLRSAPVALAGDNGEKANSKKQVEATKERLESKVYFLMPAHNEERSAKPQLEAIKNYADKMGYEYEVLVVND